MPTRFRRNLWVLIAIFFLLSGFNGVKKKKLQIVFIGDSITFGAAVQNRSTDAPAAVAAAALRQMALIEEVEFFNAGKSGATTLDFLPGSRYFDWVTRGADSLYAEHKSLGQRERLAGSPSCLLLFSIMLGTNDSAITGPNGAPVDPKRYQRNLQIIIDALLKRYPGARVVLQTPPWYSDNTYNGAKYLKQGQQRLLRYQSSIDTLVKHYSKTAADQVFAGDKTAFNFFRKKYKTMMAPENGRQGVFYLHPNKEGSMELGKKWAKALHKAAMKAAL